MYDRMVEMGPGMIACFYDVDVRDVHGEAAARRVLASTRERLRAGRAANPAAAHYVSVIARPGAPGTFPGFPEMDEDVRQVILPAIGELADSVAVSGPQTRAPGP